MDSSTVSSAKKVSTLILDAFLDSTNIINRKGDFDQVHFKRRGTTNDVGETVKPLSTLRTAFFYILTPLMRTASF